ncbi:MAG: ferritin-like fold-containing protein [Cellulomonadaceae bacterium]
MSEADPTGTDLAAGAGPSDDSRQASRQDTVSVRDTAELLGLVAHIEWNSFRRAASAAVAAVDTARGLELSRLAADAVRRRERLLAILADLGPGPEGAIEVLLGYDGAFDAYDARTDPSDTWETVLKEYVGHGIGNDFCRVVGAGLDPQVRDQLTAVLDDSVTSRAVVEMLERATEANPVLSSRLALWGRRLGGEGLGVLQQLVTEHPALARLVDAACRADEVRADEAAPTAGQGAPGATAWLFARLTAEHARRMSRLGLAA